LVGQFFAALYQDLGRVSHLLCPLPYLGWRDRAGEHMRANALRQIFPALRAQIRAASERIGGKLRHAEACDASQTLGDDVVRAVDE